ncbi:MAG TPA: S8 family peptidase, partial [Pyrinomonadaceae bacterium]|nr:S8 family peptidase [Pyrinomonadaceae bacterium]
MTNRHNAPSVSLLRAISLTICYSLLISLVALPAPRAVFAEAPPAGPAKTNVPSKARPAPRKLVWREGQLLARFRSGLRPAEIDAVLMANGMERAGRLRGLLGIERLKLSAGTDAAAAAAVLRSSGKVDFAEPNYVITADQSGPDDPRFAEQWALRNDGTGGGHFGSDINAGRGWEQTTGSEKTVVAVLDSGVDFTHPELASNAWANSREKANGVDDDKNGFVDDASGWDFVADTRDASDVQGHGTGVAGIIAAQGNNAAGITGVMWRAALMSLRVLDKAGEGDVATAAEAIEYAIANGAQVINCSWGTDGASTPLREAISLAARRGVVVVTSAGNDGRDIELTPRYPASFTQDNVIAVASTTSSDLLAEWSNWGVRHVTVAAPGVDILTLKPGGEYQTMSGSSASAPLVAGVVGLIKTQRPWLNAERTRAMILLGARPVSSLSDKVTSGGIVNADFALASLSRLAADEGRSPKGSDINGGKHDEAATRARAGAGGGRASALDASESKVTPPAATTGAPGPNLPNLDGLHGKQPTNPKAKPAIPSDRCLHSNPHCLDKNRRSAGSLLPSQMLAMSLDLPDVGPLLKNVSGMVSDSSSPLAIFANFPAAFAPYETPSTIEPVAWKNVVGATASGNDLTKTATTVWGNAGAASTRAISYGDGYMEFTVAETNTSRVVGLSNGDSNQSHTDVNFGFYQYVGGNILYIMENGTNRGNMGTYATGDKLRVSVEDGHVYYYQNGTLLYTSGLTPTYPLLVDTALYTSGATVKDAVIKGVLEGPVVENVAWKNVVGATASGNDLTKTATTAWSNSGAASTRAISYGDGYVEWTASETNLVRRIGLGTGDTGQMPGDITYAIQMYSGGALHIIENGVSLGTFGTYATGDKLRIAIENGQVNYYLNGTLLYTSLIAPVYPLLVDTSLYTAAATITDVVISGALEGAPAPQSVFWTNVVGADAVDNNLTKTAALGWGNSGAASLQTIPYGNGYVEFTASETNTNRIVGLSKGDTNQLNSDVTFGIYLNAAGLVYVIENGVSRGSFGSFATGDKLRVSVEDGHVYYYQNGTLLYTSTLALSYPLLVDTALYSAGATITDVNIQWDPQDDPSGESYATARLDPLNRTGQPGVDMLSRNINWSVPVVNLPGRAGLDLGLSLTYNSLVWTKSGSSMVFDADAGTPAPGFRLGFPVIGPAYDNAQAINSYLLVTPSGARVELQQTATANVYEAVDSSYLLLTVNTNGTLTLRDTDGTQFSYSLIQGLYRCTQIKDRNGNFISVAYHPNGNINTVTDTLSRVLTFNYDAYENLISITQPWAGEAQPHAWATFGWAAKEINTSYTTQTL